MTRLLLALIAAYKRRLSPLLPPACRYLPTCSDYMAEAVQVHGPLRGLWLGSRRLCRCHPWGGHGWDPVPPPICRPPGGSAPPPAAGR
jgi:putative membrane protein insertion efficiency factor